MALYRLTNGTAIIRESDGETIPADSMNADYQAYLIWINEGNTPDPAIAAPCLLPSQAQELLDQSDITVIRCIEHGVTVPPSWVEYRDALRNFVNGTTTAGPLPEQPAYPEGS